MASIQQTADKIKDILTICLAKSIDQALQYSMGYNWFDYFRQNDANKKKEHMILRPEHRSVYDLDFQALLKLLKFHMDLRTYVLSYYHPNETDIDIKYGRNSLFDNLLYRLMTLYRNQIAAHKKASDVERALSGEKSSTTYSYDDAIADMKKLAENFSIVVDNNGVSYYSTICSIANNYYNQSAYTYYSIQEAIDIEQLGITRNEFIQICDKFGIKVAATDTQMVFATQNYNETIAIIKNQIALIKSNEDLEKSKQNLIEEFESTKAKSHKNFVITLTTISVLTAIVLILVVINIMDMNKDNNTSRRNNEETTASTNTREQTTIESTAISITESSINEQEDPDTLSDSEISGDTGNRYINQYNYEPDEGVLTIKPANVYYEDESIIAKCYIINGTDHTINSVIIHGLELTVNGETICDAAFDSQAVEVNLEPGEHYLQEFTFPKDTVKVPDAELENLSSFCDIVED